MGCRNRNARIAIKDLVDRAMDHPKDEWVWCNGCNIVFDYDKLPDDCYLSYREHHGEPNMQPEIVPYGWICPECEHKNEL